MINVVFVLDETGSMEIRKEDTIKSFNDYIKKLKKHKNKDSVEFSLTRFNSNKIDIYYDKIKLNKVKKLKDYNPYFATPLYDAIGKTINSIDSEKCIFVILTDGEENSSSKFNYKDIVKLIKDKTDKGWEFVFLATGLDDMDAKRVAMAAADLGIKHSFSSSNTSRIHNTMYVETRTYLDNEGSTEDEK